MPDEAEEELRRFLEEPDEEEEWEETRGEVARSSHPQLVPLHNGEQPRWAARPSEEPPTRERHPPLSVVDHPWCKAPNPADTNARIPAGIRTMLVTRAQSLTAALTESSAWSITAWACSLKQVTSDMVRLSSISKGPALNLRKAATCAPQPKSSPISCARVLTTVVIFLVST